MRMLRSTVSIVALSLLGACTMEAGSPESVDEPVGQVTQKVSDAWNPGGLQNAIVGMAITSGGTAFTWLYTGHLIYGDPLQPISNVYPVLYTVPTKPDGSPVDRTTIVAVGIAKNTGLPYAWYSNGTVSHGNHILELGAKQSSFTRPINPERNTRFEMSELIEVDNSDNGEWYYYWHSGTAPHANIYRTTGTSDNASNRSTARLVNTPFPDWASIVGIAFGTGRPASLYTYRVEPAGNGQVNQSQTSLQLMPPEL